MEKFSATSSKVINKQEEFFSAVVTGNLDLIGKLVKEGANPNALDEDALTALHIAAEKGDIAVGRYLLSLKHIDINKHINTRTGDPPLITSITFNREQFAALLLTNGANPNIQNGFGRTALHCAVRKKNATMIKTLLFSKAQPNVVDAYGNTPLALSVIEYPSRTIASILLKWGAEPNFRTTKPHPLLLELALNCRTKYHLLLVKLLADNKADLNIRNLISQQTALHIASITGYVPLAKFLLKYGADSNVRDVTGRTPYEMAIEHGHLELVALYKERTKMVKDILKSILLEDDNQESLSTLNVTPKKKEASSTPRTVRFTEAQSTESDDELYMQHI